MVKAQQQQQQQQLDEYLQEMSEHQRSTVCFLDLYFDSCFKLLRALCMYFVSPGIA